MQILSRLQFLGSSVLLAANLVCSQAHAYNYFYVTNGVGTRVALVAEQIVPAPFAGLPPSYGLDYQYNVLNISATGLAIDGFSVFTGIPPGGPLRVSVIPALTAGGGFLATFGAMGNAFVPFLTAEGNAVSPVPWRFDEYDNRFPITGYAAHWVAPLAAPLPFNRWTRFDLFSANPPVLGGGAVDVDGPGGLGISFVGGPADDPGTFTFDFTSLFDQQVSQCGTIAGNPDNACQSLSDTNPFAAAGFPDAQQFGPGTITAVPEPGLFALMLSGLVFIGFVVRRRTKPGA